MVEMKASEAAITRPILRWHGGKYLLAPWIISNLPDHRTFVEPFGGAASVLLRKPRSYSEVYNDLDGEVVNLFRVVRDRGDELIRALRATPFSREEFAESYISVADPLEQARRTVVRSFMGFGSNSHNRKTGFRANSNRSGTTPAHDWANYPDAMEAIVDRLRGVVIENRPASEVIAAHDNPQALHFIDPPYVHSSRDGGIDYRHEMTDEDHSDLADCLGSVSGMVVLCGYRTELYDDLYGAWLRVDRKAFADGARGRVESLWFNGSAAENLSQKDMFAEVQP